MKPAVLNRDLECDDGIFNIRWWEDHPKLKQGTCQWAVLGGGGKQCERKAEYWCQTCGMTVCEKHRKSHSSSPHHRQRMEKWAAEAMSSSKPSNG